MNLVEVLLEQSRRRPEAAAIIETHRGSDRITSFAGLEMRSGQIATLLRGSGIEAGDPVLIFHPMSAELYAVLLGVFRIGAVAMFLDPSAGREHIDRCCELQPPRAFIAGPKAHLLRIVSGALRGIPRKFVIGPWLPGAIPICRADGESPVKGGIACGSGSPALLTFTSGSTGVPKAAVRTHGFLLAQHRVLHQHLDLIEGECDLTTLPIFLLANLASGLTSVIPEGDLRSPGAVVPEPILSQVGRHRITRCAASPAFFEQLLSAPSASRDVLVKFRKLHTGGAPVFPRLTDALGAAAPAASIEAVYGSTEAEPIAHLDSRGITAADRAAMREGGGLLAGRPIPEIQLRIITDHWGAPIGPFSLEEFGRMNVPAQQTGEIVVSGDHVLKGYLQDRGNEESKFAVGEQVWHRTGDAGRFDGQGRIWLQGRCAARIRAPGRDLYPFAVECVAMENLAVRRAAFVETSGRRILAVESAGLDAASTEAMRRDLSWAGIDELRRFDRLPVDRRHNAKIDYGALRSLLAGKTR